MNRKRLPRGAWLALGLSVGAHALLLLPALLLRARTSQAPQRLAVETCVLAPEENVLPGDATPAPQATPAAQPDRIIAVPLPPEPGPAPVPVAEAPAETAAGRQAAAAAAPAGAATGDGAGGAGRPGVSLFAVTAEGRSVVYVIDRSLSMGLNGGLAAAKREVLASLGQLPPGTRFQLVFYNRDSECLRLEGAAGLLPVNPSTRASAARFLEALRASGSTDHLEALKRALAMQPDVVFLVTDADDLTPDQVRIVTNWNQGRTAIHAIELSARDAGPAESPLTQLARANGGTYRLVPLAAGE
jgi:hypothetical protein